MKVAQFFIFLMVFFFFFGQISQIFCLHVCRTNTVRQITLKSHFPISLPRAAAASVTGSVFMGETSGEQKVGNVRNVRNPVAFGKPRELWGSLASNSAVGMGNYPRFWASPITGRQSGCAVSSAVKGRVRQPEASVHSHSWVSGSGPVLCQSVKVFLQIRIRKLRFCFIILQKFGAYLLTTTI